MALFKRDAPVDKDKVYKTIKKAFDSNGWNYLFDDDKKLVSVRVKGDDLTIPAMISVDDVSIYFMCNLRFLVPENKYMEVAYALNSLNYDLQFGKFSLGKKMGNIVFSYGYVLGSECPSQDTILEIFSLVVDTVDQFDGDLYKLAMDTGGKKSTDDSMYQRFHRKAVNYVGADLRNSIGRRQPD